VIAVPITFVVGSNVARDTLQWVIWSTVVFVLISESQLLCAPPLALMTFANSVTAMSCRSQTLLPQRQRACSHLLPTLEEAGFVLLDLPMCCFQAETEQRRSRLGQFSSMVASKTRSPCCLCDLSVNAVGIGVCSCFLLTLTPIVHMVFNYIFVAADDVVIAVTECLI
jgi:hypothetical protein